MPRLEQKTAVITGASNGIGQGIARAYAREGAHIVINYNHSKQEAELITEEIRASGGKAIAIQADISDQQEIDRLINEAQAELGCINIWVNNAGADILTGHGATLDDIAKLNYLIDVDLKGTINCCRAIAPLMQESGHGVIINMSWDLAIHGFKGLNSQMFAAVKAGVLGFSRSFAKSYAPEIRVNVLAPGWIDTAFAENVMDEEYYQERLKEIPMGRFGKPDDVAEVAVFLASDESSYMTGEMIKINGGLS